MYEGKRQEIFTNHGALPYRLWIVWTFIADTSYERWPPDYSIISVISSQGVVGLSILKNSHQKLFTNIFIAWGKPTLCYCDRRLQVHIETGYCKIMTKISIFLKITWGYRSFLPSYSLDSNPPERVFQKYFLRVWFDDLVLHSITDLRPPIWEEIRAMNANWKKRWRCLGSFAYQWNFNFRRLFLRCSSSNKYAILNR